MKLNTYRLVMVILTAARLVATIVISTTLSLG